jgi:O-antigen/teichoic acid export membrane protein
VWSFLSAGLKHHVATIFTFVYLRVNQLIVFHYCGEHETGIFAVALTLAFGLFGMVGALQLALYPRVIHFAYDHEVTTRSLRIGFYGGLLIAAFFAVLARPLLHLYGGGKYVEAVWPFRLLLPAAWLFSLSAIVAPYYIKAGMFGVGSSITVVLGCASMALNYLLVRPFAASGAAFATFATTMAGFVGTLFLMRLISGSNPMGALYPHFGQEIRAVKRLFSSRSEA